MPPLWFYDSITSFRPNRKSRVGLPTDVPGIISHLFHVQHRHCIDGDGVPNCADCTRRMYIAIKRPDLAAETWLQHIPDTRVGRVCVCSIVLDVCGYALKCSNELDEQLYPNLYGARVEWCHFNEVLILV